MTELLKTGHPLRDRELIVERPDGTRITILANLDPFFGEHSKLGGGVNCFQDISEIADLKGGGRRQGRDARDPDRRLEPSIAVGQFMADK